MTASAHASRVEARKAATSKGMGASHAAHHHGSRPVAKYCNTPDSTAAPTRQPRLSRRKAGGLGIKGSRPYHLSEKCLLFRGRFCVCSAAKLSVASALPNAGVSRAVEHCIDH